jgi:hypothetical protein
MQMFELCGTAYQGVWNWVWNGPSELDDLPDLSTLSKDENYQLLAVQNCFTTQHDSKSSDVGTRDAIGSKLGF